MIRDKKYNNPKTFSREWLKDRPSQLSNLAEKVNWTEDPLLEINKHLDQFIEEDFDPNNSLHMKSIRDAYGEKAKSLSDKQLAEIFINTADGYTDVMRGLILYNRKNPQVIVHEWGHATFYPAEQVGEPERRRRVIEDRYYDNPHEIYARLNEFRFNNNIDPSHTFTLKDVRKLRRSKNIRDFNLFSRYTDEFILHLLNDVAYNENEDRQSLRSIDPITLAKNGASLVLKSQLGTKLLVPHKDYLGIPYKQDGDYNYFEAHPENMPTNSGEHWTSRNPVTGQLLKSENHSTFNSLLNGEKEAGMQIYSGLNGELYSYPKEQIVPLYLRKFNYGKQ